MIKKVWFCKILAVILFLIFAVSLITAQNNTHSGLLLSEQYKSRLNLSVDNKYSVKDSLQISFDISLDTEKYWGNIFFLGDENDFYINLSLITYRSEDSSYIVLFINQQESTISFVDLKGDLDLLSWEHFDIKLNLINNKISVTYKNITKDIHVDLPDELELDIIFGGVPPFHYLAGLDACYFAVRNIKLSIDKKREHNWKLDEVKGDYAYDEIGFKRGKQEHSEWLQSYHTGWKEIIRFDSDYMPGITFNENKSEIYSVNQEYMTKFNIISREKEEIEFRKKRPRTANTAIFNNVTNKLLSYYHGTGQISEFEEESKTWSSIDISKDTMQHYYVHTNFVDSGNGYVYILGGYGWFIMKNDLQKYDFNNKIWQKINITGDFYKPRSNPLISSGRNKGEFYVFGGMGNKSGKQEEGYKPIKDLHLLNLNENTFTKLWENNDSAVALPVTNRSGNLVADYDKNVLYAMLINDHRDSEILSSSRLCEISIDSGYIKEISNPISDEDKLWNMHLFFCKYSNSFILAAGKLTDVTKVKGEVIIYSLIYPPLSNEQLIENQKKKEVRYAKYLTGNTLSYIIAGLTIVFFSFFILRYKRGRKKVSLQIKDNKSTLHISDDKNRITNSINILGNFLMIDKDGKEKEIFIYNNCDHADCYKEVESQAICYTAGVPPVAAAMLIAGGEWDTMAMVNVEELDPDPFISLLDRIGLKTMVEERPAPLDLPNKAQANESRS